MDVIRITRVSSFNQRSKEKWQTTVSAVIFEIVEMYIFQIYLHYFVYMLYIKAKPWFILFLILFQKYTCC